MWRFWLYIFLIFIAFSILSNFNISFALLHNDGCAFFFNGVSQNPSWWIFSAWYTGCVSFSATFPHKFKLSSFLLNLKGFISKLTSSASIGVLVPVWVTAEWHRGSICFSTFRYRQVLSIGSLSDWPPYWTILTPPCLVLGSVCALDTWWRVSLGERRNMLLANCECMVLLVLVRIADYPKLARKYMSEILKLISFLPLNVLCFFWFTSQRLVALIGLTLHYTGYATRRRPLPLLYTMLSVWMIPGKLSLPGPSMHQKKLYQKVSYMYTTREYLRSQTAMSNDRR